VEEGGISKASGSNVAVGVGNMSVADGNSTGVPVNKLGELGVSVSERGWNGVGVAVASEGTVTR
jgi:hypothetical protein